MPTGSLLSIGGISETLKTEHITAFYKRLPKIPVCSLLSHFRIRGVLLTETRGGISYA